MYNKFIEGSHIKKDSLLIEMVIIFGCILIELGLWVLFCDYEPKIIVVLMIGVLIATIILLYWKNRKDGIYMGRFKGYFDECTL